MARIRSIKPAFWASEALATRLCGPDGRQARLLFIALWNHAEDHGVCRAAPNLLRSVAFPYDDDVTSADVSRWLGMLDDGRFIVRYERDGSSYLWVRSFDEHQKIDRKSKTTLPEPSHEEKSASSRARRGLVEPSLQEGKGRERKGEDVAVPVSAPPAPAPLAPTPSTTPSAGERMVVQVFPAAHGAPVQVEFPDTAASVTAKGQREARVPKAARDSKHTPQSDPRHAPLKEALVRAPKDEGAPPYAFRGGRDGKAVSELLGMADQDPATRGELAPAEVLRRWRIGRAWRGFPECTDLGALATHWNRYSQPQAGGGAGPPGSRGDKPRLDPRPSNSPAPAPAGDKPRL
ncbi:hypothetical protein D7V97_16050 [Corallococcus sp. CA053C]|uniref:hypothetical protein n=1 Tax=Corallococcus sp. CA053C TaxID=2316732 RepID=UPI000EA21D19|nr:hypothetical protein [Corallococcus sp. CA053C]RKH09597.1 hypothetical protein D7V97_16050 [Corallococcus sp. CA053C]